jgi:pimeloyl-ACP methyl ester carboxylesterase
MARMVLVHGAFAGAWCWEPTVAGLESAGHVVETLDLPGAGDDRTPVEQIDLRAYADRVVSQLERSDEPAVLVGHSMGGMVITQAAALAPARVAQLVFVCAFMPHDGQSLLELTQLPEGAADQVQANLVVAGDPPVATLPQETCRDTLFNCCTEEQTVWGTARLGTQPIAPFTSPVEVPEGALDEIRRAYVLCSNDHAIPPELQRRMIAEHGVADVVELNTDHMPFLSVTDELVAALDRFARIQPQPPN